MKKTLTLFAFLSLLAGHAFATYIVVLKDGTKMKAKTKWTVRDGKALITLENGQTMLLSMAEIDVAKSEQVTKSGMGDANVLSLDAQQQGSQPQPQPKGDNSLGAQVRAMRPRAPMTATGTPTTSVPASTPATPVIDQLDPTLKDKFERAFENVGIFDYRMAGTNRNVRAELTADNEDKVFNAISATAFLVAHNAGMDNMKIDQVELFMKTTNGLAAGRFQMSRADADAINGKTLSLPDYFVRKVIY
jgi:hypothetical protein